MSNDLDHYELYYADKLWALLPAVYRAQDTDTFDRNGPLRELVNRIGAQAAIVRRSIDRMWDDQSIETCDDWIIPYIADLLATNLVTSLDARGQRLDVAKTIYYRRRKGTVALLEELAHDITGWDARVVEFFRRLGRTRHGFDPEIGLPSASPAPLDARTLQLAEGLVGQLTKTSIGGWADLRNVYGALQAQSPFGVYDKAKPPSAFDEYFHTADFRRGRGRSGWHNISRLGVFLWRLYSFPLFEQEPDALLVTPVQNVNPACANHYAFDPTGREIPLFARASGEQRLGDRWLSPEEWQLPTPISKALLDLDRQKQLDKDHQVENKITELYSVQSNPLRMNSVGVFRNEVNNLLHFKGSPIPLKAITGITQLQIKALVRQNITDVDGFFNTPVGTLVNILHATAAEVNTLRTAAQTVIQTRDSGTEVSINPERGTFTITNPQATDPDKLRVWYHYGFSSPIGAGVYERRRRDKELPPLPAPVTSTSNGGNVPSPGATGTVVIKDSLTYDSASAVGTGSAQIREVAIWANSAPARGKGVPTRPLVRLASGAEWAFTGANGGRLHLEGLFVSGGDLVLKGEFEKVTISCCTFDPGNSGASLEPPAVFVKSIDGRDLVASRLWIEGQVGQLEIDRSIIGPIHTRDGGAVEELTITDSIAQAIRTSDLGLFVPEDIKDPIGLAKKLVHAVRGFSLSLRKRLSARDLKLLEQLSSQPEPDSRVASTLVRVLNRELKRTGLYDPKLFGEIPLTPATTKLIGENPTGAQLVRLNRLLLEEAFPVELADSVLAFGSGEVRLVRSTIIGPAYVHRLDASESILDGNYIVDDYQHGCVRFSAWTSGSILPRKYESVEIPADSALFTSRVFGHPGYAQLLETVDAAVLPGQANSTIAQGAENGSEMGAFARENHPLKERSLRIKYDEFMPIGLIPVIIYVT